MNFHLKYSTKQQWRSKAGAGGGGKGPRRHLPEGRHFGNFTRGVPTAKKVGEKK